MNCKPKINIKNRTELHFQYYIHMLHEIMSINNQFALFSSVSDSSNHHPHPAEPFQMGQREINGTLL
jgi:hypothetical protein